MSDEIRNVSTAEDFARNEVRLTVACGPSDRPKADAEAMAALYKRPTNVAESICRKVAGDRGGFINDSFIDVSVDLTPDELAYMEEPGRGCLT